MACIYVLINKAAGKSGEPQNQQGISPQRSVKQADLGLCVSILLPREECDYHQDTSAVYQFLMASVTNCQKKKIFIIITI